MHQILTTMTTTKKRKKNLIVSYKNLSDDLKELFKSAYPDGYSNFLQRFEKPNGETIFVVPFETDDTCYETKRGPQNMLVQLDDIFTRDDAVRVRKLNGMPEHGVDAQLRQYVSRGYVTVVTDNSFRKLKYKTAV